MPTRVKKNSPPNDAGRQANGLYVHSSPPKVLQVHSSVIRQWLRAGDIAQLEQLVLQGQGHKLLGEYSPDPKVRNFLRQLPSYMAKSRKLHEAVGKGDLKRVQNLLESRGQEPPLRSLHLSKNHVGVGLLHKAVYHGHLQLVEFLASAYPQTVNMRDNEGKTPLHYCGASKDAGKIWPLLVRAGADAKLVDSRGRLPVYYMERSNEIQLPEEKILSRNSPNVAAEKNGLVIKPSNIRIWIHDRDLRKLQQVIWEGHGAKLRVETSNNPKVKRFLDGVPYILNAIKDVHSSVVNDDLAEFRKKTADPVPVEILSSKDINGLNPLHKAAGLGREKIAEEILRRNKSLISAVDHGGRTPLHFAAALKDNNAMFHLLLENNADEAAVDKSGRTAAHYRNNPKDIPVKILEVVPEAPRTSLAFPQVWDWGLFNGDTLPSTTLSSSSISNLSSEMPVSKPKTPEEESKDEDEEKVKEEGNTEAEDPVIENGEDLVAVNGEDPDSLNEAEPVTANGKESESEEKTSETEPENEAQVAEEADAVEEKGPDEESRKFDIWTNEEDGREEGRNSEEEESSSDWKKNLEEEGRAVQKQVEEESKKVTEEMSAEMIAEREKTEWELAEERQRLLDEGLLRVNTEDDEDEDEENDKVDLIIAKADMEKLASMVLEGEGDKLQGKKSSNPEIQSFLNNLPTYMAKISAVHKAARSGSLRDLQGALDRRRFAVAKESSDKLGTTPLHKAVLFGNTQIAKYLGGRFPETLMLKDKHGRTPLHYAAVLQDGGNLYGILSNLGADENVVDDTGHTPRHYRDNPGDLKREDILEELGDSSVDLAGEGVGTPVTDPSVHEAEPEVSFDEGIPLSRARGMEDGEDEDQGQQSHFNPTDRDEYGQSVLHFAAARAHGRSGLFQLIHESGVNLGYRDELYRTARDIAVQANIPENVNEIDKYVISLAAKGETGKLVELFLEGYDHILDLEDDEENDILTVVTNKNHEKTLALLKAIPFLEEKREKVQRAIRAGELRQVEGMVAESKNGRLVVVGKSSTGRCALHVAVLCQQKDITEFIAQKFPETLRIGDNLERTALHYAMAVDDVETLSKTLIKCGAKRVVKDLKGRQPTYYFMNKSEILKLQEEEASFRT